MDTHYRNGSVVLYKRDDSNRWQSRFRVDKKWHRFATGEIDLDHAAEIACERFDIIQLRKKADLPTELDTRFSDIMKGKANERTT